MKILITGGAGFIGSHVQDELIRLGHTVAVLDNLRSGSRENLNEKTAFFYEADITDRDKVSQIMNDFKPEIVFHFAAQNNVPDSMKDPYLDLDYNIAGTFNVAYCAHLSGARRIIYSNTGGALYGEQSDENLPIKEDQIIDRPTSFYGVSKGVAEEYFRLFQHVYGLEWVSLRFANVYGPRQVGKGEAGIIAIFTQKMVDGEQAVIFGDGLHTRDYVYISDIVKACIMAMSLKESDYLHISSGIEVSNIQIYQIMAKYLGISDEPTYAPDRPGDVRRSVLDQSKMLRLLDWKPTVTIEEGIHRTIDYYRRNKNK